MMKISARSATDVGKKRNVNEDAAFVDEAAGFFVLADGMGGHESGALASKAAVETMLAELAGKRTVFDRFRDDPSEAASGAAIAAVVAAFERTCAHVFDLGGEGKSRRRMGSTLDVVVRMGDHALLAHVGDGRVYMVRDGKCNRLTEDHTIVAEQLRAGIVTPEEAEKSPYRGVLTRAMGTHQSVKVDTLLVELNDGDHLLMCTDGLHKYADEARLAALLGPSPSPDVVTKLVDHANASGGADNVSVILVGFHEAAVAAPPPDATGARPLGRTLPLGDTQSRRVSSRIDAICKLPLFQHLSYREQVAVLAVAKSRIYEEGATIVQQGTAGSEMFIIIDGRLAVERDGVKIAELGPGGHFGEMSLVDDATRSATVKARTRTDVLSIGQNEMNGLMRVDPVLGVKILWNFVQVLSMRLRTASAEIIELQMAEARGPTTLRVPFGPATERQ